MPKEAVLGWFEEWLPLLVPAVLLLGRVVAAFKVHTYTIAQVPSDLSYYGATIYVWALTNHLSGGQFSLSDAGKEGALVSIALLANLSLYWLFFPSYGNGSFFTLAAALLVSFAFGPASAIYLRARI